MLYLEKVKKTDRKELPKLMWICYIFISCGKSTWILLCFGWVYHIASESLQQIGALAIAFVIFIILIGFTHFIDAAYVRGQVFEKQLNQAILAVCK